MVEPLPAGGGFVFENEVGGGAVRKEYVQGVEKGLESMLGSGVLAGFPVVDLKVVARRWRRSRLMSHGRATFAMQFDHYEELPGPGEDPPFRPAIGMRA